MEQGRLMSITKGNKIRKVIAGLRIIIYYSNVDGTYVSE